MAIQGCVPGDIPDRRERDGRQSEACCPGGDAIEQSAADTGTLMIRLNAHLFDVCAAVDDVDEHVADRHIQAVDCDPRSAVFRVVGEHLDGYWLVIRDLRQTNIAKPL